MAISDYFVVENKTKKRMPLWAPLGGKAVGNIISIHPDSPKDKWLKMSNGLTSVVISLIGLSGSRLAKREDEKLHIIWILEKDQSACGIGTVSFELSEMPWDQRYLNRQRLFMLAVLDGIDQQLGWETLNYEPNQELIRNCTSQFREMLEKLTEHDIDETAGAEWRKAATEDDPIHNGFPKCPKHDVYLTVFGCHICNDR